MESFLSSCIERTLRGQFLPGSLLLFIFLLAGGPANAQNKFTRDLHAMVNLHHGYNIPEYPFIATITNAPIRGVNLSLYKETRGKNPWEQVYKYPEFGISLFYSSLGNDEVFGRELSMVYFLRVYFLSRNRFKMYQNVGIGGSYTSRKFDLEDNYTNVAIGSHLNIHFNYRLGANFAISDRYRLNSGLSFDHLSNGNVVEPNLGLNSLSAFGGFSYRLGEQSELQVHDLPKPIRKTDFSIYAAIGGKHTRSLSATYFLAHSISLELNRNISRKVHFGFGADWFYDSSVKSSLEREDREYHPSYRFQTGLHLTQSIVYNRFKISIQEGVYLGLPERVDNFRLYNRGILQYHFTDHFSVRIAMKSHLYILDYPELGIGYKF